MNSDSREKKYQKEWRKKNRAALLKYAKEYYQANKEAFREYNQKTYKANKKKILARGKKYRLENWEKINKRRKEFREETGGKSFRVWCRKLRLEMIAGYGGKCCCCGETTSLFLQLDHKHNDGHYHKKQGARSNTTLYSKLKKQNWPKEDFQLLCANCNMGKELNNGICPHKKTNDDPQRISLLIKKQRELNVKKTTTKKLKKKLAKAKK